MKTAFARTIGMNIAKFRDDHRWSQEGLAERMNVDESTVQRWESGCVVPDGADIFKLSIVFGVSTDAIYKGLPKSIAEVDRLYPRKRREHSSLS